MMILRSVKQIHRAVIPKVVSFPPTQFNRHFFNTSGNNGSNNNEAGNENAATDSASTASNEANETLSEEASQAEVIDPISQQNEEIKLLRDKVKRLLAEEENVRRIARKDVADARSYANTSFAKAMLDIADDLERAINSVPEEKKNNLDDPSLKGLLDGVIMTEKNLQKVFEKFNVKKFGKIDDPFDPSLHDALFNIPNNEKPGTIGQVIKHGYKLNDRVIRAAQVGARTDSA
jgi:molecular chaperone GrpE